MQLEVITTPGRSPSRDTPILLVHGLYSSARIWEPYFQPFFAEHGYTTHAMSLRGHGTSEGVEQIPYTRLADYVADVAHVAAEIDPAPILIGTSMGGMLVQHHLHNHKVPAAVLLGSGPPHGMIPSLMSMVASNPFLATELSMAAFFGPQMMQICQRALFRTDTPSDYIQSHFFKPRRESPMAMLDMLAFDLPPSRPRKDVPVLVLGAEKDAFVTPQAVRETARAFETEEVIFPGMPHAMMLDPEWETVARHILDWLDRVLPAKA
ncbi:alpha/beta hydrolase [Magnetospira thiophila]